MTSAAQKIAPKYNPKANKIKTSVGSKIFDFFNYALMVFFCFMILYPIWEMIVISFSDATAVSHISVNIWPKRWVTDSYAYCLKSAKLFVALRNSVARTVVGTVWHLFLCSMAAYAMTRNRMPFRGFFITVFVITMFFSGGTIPTYLNIKNLGLQENFLVYVLPGGFSIYNTIIIRNYFYSIDNALEEAAAIDGATPMQTLTRVILPLSKPVLATVGLWVMVGQWNAWYDNMVYCKSEGLVTLQYLLKTMNNQLYALQDELNTYAQIMGVRFEVASETVVAATTVIVIVPIICTYPFLQKYFVKGIMLGAVKG